MRAFEIIDNVTNGNQLRTSLVSIVGIVISPPIPTTIRVAWPQGLSDGERVQPERKVSFGSRQERFLRFFLSDCSEKYAHNDVVSLGPLVVTSVVNEVQTDISTSHLTSMEGNVNGTVS